MKLATIKDVAAILRMKESTLYSWVGSGLIPSFKINGLVRFDLDEIAGWVAASKKLSLKPKERAKQRIGITAIDEIINQSIESVAKSGYTSSGKGKARRISKPGRSD